MFLSLTITVVYQPAHAHCSYCLFKPETNWLPAVYLPGQRSVFLGSLVWSHKNTKTPSQVLFDITRTAVGINLWDQPSRILSVSYPSPDQVAFRLPAGAVLVNCTYFCRKDTSDRSELLLSLTDNEQMSPFQVKGDIDTLPPSLC